MRPNKQSWYNTFNKEIMKMKISIIGLHHVIQTLTLKDDTLGINNPVIDYNLKHDDTLINLALTLKEGGHTVDMRANFNASSLSMRALKKLEEANIVVYPDLQDHNHQTIHIKSNNVFHTFNDATPLHLINPQALETTDYIIANSDDHDLLSTITSNTNAKIIILDKLPPFRSQNFVDALIFDTLNVSDEQIDSLLKNGISWVATIHHDHIIFRTLKSTYKLNLNQRDAFINAFLSSLENHTLIQWLDSKKS